MPRLVLAIVAMALGVLILGEVQPALAQVKIPAPGSTRYRIQYPDSAISANDVCPVLDRGLGPAKIPFYVNGVPIGFC